MGRAIIRKVIATEEKKIAQQLGAVANDLQLKSEGLSKVIAEKEHEIFEAESRRLALLGSIEIIEEKLGLKKQMFEAIVAKISEVKQEGERQDAVLKIKALSARKELENNVSGLLVEKLNLEKQIIKNTSLIDVQKKSLAAIAQDVLDTLTTKENLLAHASQLKEKIAGMNDLVIQKTGILEALENKLSGVEKILEAKRMDVSHADELIADQSSIIDQNQGTISKQEVLKKEKQDEVNRLEKQIEDMTMTIGNVNIQKQKNEQFAQRLQKKAEQMGINIKLD